MALRQVKLDRRHPECRVMSSATFTLRSFFDSFFAFLSLSVFSFLSFTLILTPPAAPVRLAGAASIPAPPHSLVTSSPFSACTARNLFGGQCRSRRCGQDTQMLADLCAAAHA